MSLCCAQAFLYPEGHMDDGLILQLCQHEESRAARIIRNTTQLFTQFIRSSTTSITVLDSTTDTYAFSVQGVFAARITEQPKCNLPII